MRLLLASLLLFIFGYYLTRQYEYIKICDINSNDKIQRIEIYSNIKTNNKKFTANYTKININDHKYLNSKYILNNKFNENYYLYSTILTYNSTHCIQYTYEKDKKEIQDYYFKIHITDNVYSVNSNKEIIHCEKYNIKYENISSLLIGLILIIFGLIFFILYCIIKLIH